MRCVRNIVAMANSMPKSQYAHLIVPTAVVGDTKLTCQPVGGWIAISMPLNDGKDIMKIFSD